MSVYVNFSESEVLVSILAMKPRHPGDEEASLLIQFVRLT